MSCAAGIVANWVHYLGKSYHLFGFTLPIASPLLLLLCLLLFYTTYCLILYLFRVTFFACFLSLVALVHNLVVLQYAVFCVLDLNFFCLLLSSAYTLAHLQLVARSLSLFAALASYSGRFILFWSVIVLSCARLSNAFRSRRCVFACISRVATQSVLCVVLFDLVVYILHRCFGNNTWFAGSCVRPREKPFECANVLNFGILFRTQLVFIRELRSGGEQKQTDFMVACWLTLWSQAILSLHIFKWLISLEVAAVDAARFLVGRS